MKRGFLCLGHLVLGLAAAAAFSALVMCLWNWLMPTIFGLTVISFWQALGLLVLSKLLFSGCGHHRWGMKHRHHGHIHKKWMKMTCEEQKEFLKKHHHFHSRYDCCDKEKEENKE